MSELVTGEVFQYMYTYNGEHHWLDNEGLDGARYGVDHADDLFSLFRPFVGFGVDGDGGAGIALSPEDEAVALRHASIFAAFATGGPDSLRQDFGWEPVVEADSAGNHRYLRIDADLAMEASDYYLARMRFWEANEPFEYM